VKQVRIALAGQRDEVRCLALAFRRCLVLGCIGAIATLIIVAVGGTVPVLLCGDAEEWLYVIPGDLSAAVVETLVGHRTARELIDRCAVGVIVGAEASVELIDAAPGFVILPVADARRIQQHGHVVGSTTCPRVRGPAVA